MEATQHAVCGKTATFASPNSGGTGTGTAGLSTAGLRSHVAMILLVPLVGREALAGFDELAADSPQSVQLSVVRPRTARFREMGGDLSRVRATVSEQASD